MVIYVTNDSEYKKEYETERNVGVLNSTSLVEGIDYYLTNISKNFAVLLRQCTSPNNNKEIEDVLNTISTLSTRANTRIKSYLMIITNHYVKYKKQNRESGKIDIEIKHH